MNELTYLSVDIDNWANEEFPFKFLDRIKDLKVPIAVSVHHHELLGHINKFRQCRRLVNIDMHADVCGDCTDDDLNCGTWGNFVTWRKRKDTSFVWSYPDPTCVIGKTNWTGCWCDDRPESNPFFKKNPRDFCGWEKVLRRHAPILKRDELNNIIAVGICLSPDYLHSRNITEWTNQFLGWIKKTDCKVYSSKSEWKRWREY